MAKNLSDKKNQKGFLQNIDDVKFLLENGYTPQRLLIFYDVNGESLQYLMAQMAVSVLRAN